VSKHHLPARWRRLATSCANTLMTRAPERTHTATETPHTHTARLCSTNKKNKTKGNRARNAQTRSTTECVCISQAPLRGAHCAGSPVREVREKARERRLYRLHTLRIVVAMTNAAKFSQWIPRHGEACSEFPDFSIKCPQTWRKLAARRRRAHPEADTVIAVHSYLLWDTGYSFATHGATSGGRR